MRSFKDWLNDRGLVLPKGYLDDHNYALRYLTKVSDMQETYDMIMQMEQWLVEDLIPNLSDISKQAKYLEAGAIYAHGRDKHMRPIII